MISAALIELQTQDEVRAAANAEPHGYLPLSFYFDRMLAGAYNRLCIEQLKPNYVVFGWRATIVMMKSLAGRSYIPNLNAKPGDLWLGSIQGMHACLDAHDLVDPDVVVVIGRKRKNPDQFTVVKFFADPLMH